MKKNIILFFLFLYFVEIYALYNGPVLSDLTYREAQIWVQTYSNKSVKIKYYERDFPNEIYFTKEYKTIEDNGYTANLTLAKIEPNKDYCYEVLINDQQSNDPYYFKSLDYFHENSPPPNVKICLLGAHYQLEEEFEPPYRVLGGGYDIFQKIYENSPNLLIWVGNTAHLRKSDIDSKSGYLKRYTESRKQIIPKTLFSEIPNLSIWSHYDYGISNNGKEMSLKNQAREAFSAFWPKTSLIKHQNALCYNHKISDIELFFLDVKSESKLDLLNRKNVMLGYEQMNWLKSSLKNSSAKFKLIISGAPILNPIKSKYNFSFFEDEKIELLEFLNNEKIEGVIFISGGSYSGELTRIKHSNFYSLYDLTIGPVTANPTVEKKDLNYYRVPGTKTIERQFTILEFLGSEENRRLRLIINDLTGTKIWSKIININELYY